MSYKQILGYNSKMKKTEVEHPELMFRCFTLPAFATCFLNAVYFFFLFFAKK